jgi:hypothetical protein
MAKKKQVGEEIGTGVAPVVEAEPAPESEAKPKTPKEIVVKYRDHNGETVEGTFATCWDRTKDITMTLARPIAQQGCTSVPCRSGRWPHRGQPAPRRFAPSIRPNLISGRHTSNLDFHPDWKTLTINVIRGASGEPRLSPL